MQPLSIRIPRFFTTLGEVLHHVLGSRLVGVYTYGSLTYQAFDPRRSDLDCIAVVRRPLRSSTVARLRQVLRTLDAKDPLMRRLQLSLLVRGRLFEFNGPGWLYQFGRLTSTGSDGNPIPWVNILECGLVIRGAAPQTFVPPIRPAQLRAALVRELGYLHEELVTAPASQWRHRLFYRRYAILTLCRILYTFRTGRVVSKPVAAAWVLRREARAHGRTIRQALRTSRQPVPLRAVRDFLAAVERRVIDHGSAQGAP